MTATATTTTPKRKPAARAAAAASPIATSRRRRKRRAAAVAATNAGAMRTKSTRERVAQEGALFSGLAQVESLGVPEKIGAFFAEHYEALERDPAMLEAARMAVKICKDLARAVSTVRERATQLNWATALVH